MKELSKAELTVALLRDVIYADPGSPEQNRAIDRAWRMLNPALPPALPQSSGDGKPAQEGQQDNQGHTE